MMDPLFSLPVDIWRDEILVYLSLLDIVKASNSFLSREVQMKFFSLTNTASAMIVALVEPIVDTPALRHANRNALRVSAGRWWPRDCAGTDLDMPSTYRWNKVPWAPEVLNKDIMTDMDTYCFTCCKQLADDARNTCPVCMRWVLVECAHQCLPDNDENWGKCSFYCCFCGDESIRSEWEDYKEDHKSKEPSRANFDA